MALTGSIKKDSYFKNEVLNSFLEKYRPVRDMFDTNLAGKPFDTKHPIMVPKTDNKDSYTVLGCVSELYIDVLLGKFIDNKQAVYSEIENIVTPLSGYYSNPGASLIEIKKTSYKDSRQKIDICLGRIKDYMNGEEIDEKTIINDLYILYKHDKGHVFRQIPPRERLDEYKTSNPVMYAQFNEEAVTSHNEQAYSHIFGDTLEASTVDEIINIGTLFQKSFFDSGVVRPDSEVIINPCWGAWSEVIGAEGDICIDGIIYDIKSRSKQGYKKDEAMQILGYYLCSVLNEKYDININGAKSYRTVSNMNNIKVSSVGIYLSRYGEAVVCPVENLMDISDDEIEKLANAASQMKIERANKRIDAINNYLSSIGSDTLARRDDKKANIYTKVIKNDIPLDWNRYEAYSLSEFVSRAMPPKKPMSIDISDMKPVMWVGDIPAEVINNNYYYIIRFRVHFGRKQDIPESDLLYDAEDLKNRRLVYDEKTNMYYQKIDYSSFNMPDSYNPNFNTGMTKEDYELFKTQYHIYLIEDIKGVYFIPQ